MGGQTPRAFFAAGVDPKDKKGKAPRTIAEENSTASQAERPKAPDTFGAGRDGLSEAEKSFQ